MEVQGASGNNIRVLESLKRDFSEIRDTSNQVEQPQKVVITKEQLEKAVDEVNHLLTPYDTALNYQLHEELNEYYVQIIDRETKEVIREIPPKDFLDKFATMLEVVGFIIDESI